MALRVFDEQGLYQRFYPRAPSRTSAWRILSGSGAMMRPMVETLGNDTLDAKTSFTEIESIIHLTPDDKQIQGLAFY